MPGIIKMDNSTAATHLPGALIAHGWGPTVSLGCLWTSLLAGPHSICHQMSDYLSCFRTRTLPPPKALRLQAGRAATLTVAWLAPHHGTLTLARFSGDRPPGLSLGLDGSIIVGLRCYGNTTRRGLFSGRMDPLCTFRYLSTHLAAFIPDQIRYRWSSRIPRRRFPFQGRKLTYLC